MSNEVKLGGIKHDQDKPDFSLLPLISTEEVVKVWTFGKKKYSAWNWTNGFVFSRPYAAALRHMFSWFTGQSHDPETGLHHLAHAICCLQMLIEFEITGTGKDDRRKTFKEPEIKVTDNQVVQNLMNHEPGAFTTYTSVIKYFKKGKKQNDKK